jgi:hypothetical protein
MSLLSIDWLGIPAMMAGEGKLQPLLGISGRWQDRR